MNKSLYRYLAFVVCMVAAFGSISCSEKIEERDRDGFSTLTFELKFDSGRKVWVLFDAESQLPSKLLSPIAVMQGDQKFSLIYSSSSDSYFIKDESGKSIKAEAGEIVVSKGDDFFVIDKIKLDPISLKGLEEQISEAMKSEGVIP